MPAADVDLLVLVGLWVLAGSSGSNPTDTSRWYFKTSPTSHQRPKSIPPTQSVDFSYAASSTGLCMNDPRLRRGDYSLPVVLSRPSLKASPTLLVGSMTKSVNETTEQAGGHVVTQSQE